MSVKKYRRFFYSLPEVANRPEEELIALAKAGLKEEIRQGQEKEEFATLDALFEEAEEVEEGLKETPPSSPRKRRRTSPDHRSSKRGRKSVIKGDPEDEGYGYDGEAATEEEGSERDYWKWMDMETTSKRRRSGQRITTPTRLRLRLRHRHRLRLRHRHRLRLRLRHRLATSHSFNS
ncbi:hypothetical protein Bca52824_018431 [Brassica carinata]|uniref:Uncharacterized protein n=1 Tax=Brassica carinata TaxID=52824 RepID=A0A8X8AWD8_BRACI|nr:hypothetical protein Bca52824_018431 [Brassica carinata]